MRDQINKLKDERVSLIEQMRSVNNTAEAEGRDLTAEEAQEFDRLEQDVKALGERSSRLEKLSGFETLERRQIEPAPEPDDDDGDAGWVENDAPNTFREFNERRGGRLVQDDPEYRRAWFRMMTVRDLRELGGDELRVLSKASAGAGANLVPTGFERQLIDALRDFGVMRDISTVITTDSGDALEVPTVSSHGAAAWTAENAAYTESDEVFGKSTLNAYKAATIMKVSEELLTDAAFDLDAFIREQFGQRIGVLENTAYVVGDGSGKPTGVATTATAGVTAAATGAVTTDELIDLYHSVLSPYRRNAVFLTGDTAIKGVRKLKDSTNQYMWQPGLVAGQPDTLLGKPIYADPDMASPAASAKSILFGDFSYYRIRDVRGISFQRLNELYAANGQVGFRAYHRTDGKLLNTNAIKALVQAAS